MSSSTLPPPLSLRDCYVDGSLDVICYYAFSRKRRQTNHSRVVLQSIIDKSRCRSNKPVEAVLIKRQYYRSVKKHKILVRDPSGCIREIKPTDTLWYLLYIGTSPRNNRLRKLFRTRFRLPHHSFLELANEISHHELFARWSSSDCTGVESSNIKILLLGAMRYLGRGFTFDDIEECTAISREVNRVFFHNFLLYGSTVLYKKHVSLPASTTDPSEWERLFKLAGFSGCIGSSDGTHIGMLNCHSWATINHKGPKLNIPSRTYNTTVTHTRQILGTTFGHPATWNDKTIVLYDELLKGVKNGTLFEDYEFILFEYDSTGNIIEVCYKGVWFMVDNGYLSWSNTVPPLKDGLTYQQIRFSEWLESMRKDVECTFGILKDRFPVLRYGVRLRSIEKCDQLYVTCCALHNRLLFIDGLDKGWKDGVESNWERENRDETPFAVQRLHRLSNNDNVQSHDDNDDNIVNTLHYNNYEVNGKRIVSKMPLTVFQNRLIEHFDICFKRNDIQWPKRINPPRPVL